jgi:virginiamycin A acetyltransferase
MKIKIQNFMYRIIKLFVPEMVILKKNIIWNYLADSQQNSTLSEKARVNSLFHLMNTSIDDYTYVDINSYISETKIGKFCSIGPNLTCGWGIHPTNGISTSPMFYSTKKQNGITLSKENKIKERKPIKIGNDVLIGINVTILDGINIGDAAVIGAGSVVSKDIPHL